MLKQILPVVAAAFAPVITAIVKKAVGQVGGEIPNALKPVINALIGAVVAGLTGGSAAEGLAAAQVGKSVRDQFDRAPAAVPPIQSGPGQ